MSANVAGGLLHIFGESWRLLARNPLIALPPVLIAFGRTYLEQVLTPGPDASAAQHLAGIVVQDVVQLVATVLSIAFVTGMAAAAWARGRCSLADGWNAFRRDGYQVLIALLLLSALGSCAAFLAPFTFGLTIVAFGFFCLYVMPSAIVRERDGFHAIGESFELAYENFVSTFVLVLGLFLIVLGVGILAAIVSAVAAIGPIVSEIVAALLVGAVLAYATLVITGKYIASFRPGSVA